MTTKKAHTFLYRATDSSAVLVLYTVLQGADMKQHSTKTYDENELNGAFEDLELPIRGKAGHKRDVTVGQTGQSAGRCGGRRSGAIGGSALRGEAADTRPPGRRAGSERKNDIDCLHECTMKNGVPYENACDRRKFDGNRRKIREANCWLS